MTHQSAVTRAQDADGPIGGRAFGVASIVAALSAEANAHLPLLLRVPCQAGQVLPHRLDEYGTGHGRIVKVDAALQSVPPRD